MKRGPKTIVGYWFCKNDLILPNGDGRKIEIGVTHKVEGEIVPCKHGLHASERPLDALSYAPGLVACKVILSGKIISHNGDKYAASERKYIHIADATETLRLFARKCALDVIHLWDAPDVVVRYLKTGDELLRAAAWDAAWDAARAAAGDAAWDAARAAAWAAAGAAAGAPAWAAARDAAWDAARAAARDAARDAARAAAGAPAWAAAWAAARDAARAAAWAAAWDAAWDAARRKQNRRLATMLSNLWREKA
jgi:hypothetical protein